MRDQRCRRALLVLGAIAALLLPTSAYADHPIQPQGSGFHKAQSAPRRIIAVWQCGPCNLPLKTITTWNETVGWKMLDWTGDKDNADIRVVNAGPGKVTGTDLFTDNSGTGNYRLAIIYLEDWAKGSAYPTIHELGHALGFADHVHRYQFADYFATGANPRVCDGNPDFWAWSAYPGIMSYCANATGIFPHIWSDTWFQNQDEWMLYRQGYRLNQP